MVTGHTDTLIAILRAATWGEVNTELPSVRSKLHAYGWLYMGPGSWLCPLLCGDELICVTGSSGSGGSRVGILIVVLMRQRAAAADGGLPASRRGWLITSNGASNYQESRPATDTLYLIICGGVSAENNYNMSEKLLISTAHVITAQHWPAAASCTSRLITCVGNFERLKLGSK